MHWFVRFDRATERAACSFASLFRIIFIYVKSNSNEKLNTEKFGRNIYMYVYILHEMFHNITSFICRTVVYICSVAKGVIYVCKLPRKFIHPYLGRNREMLMCRVY